MIKITGGLGIKDSKSEKKNLYIENGKIEKTTDEDLLSEKTVDEGGNIVKSRMC